MLRMNCDQKQAGCLAGDFGGRGSPIGGEQVMRFVDDDPVRAAIAQLLFLKLREQPGKKSGADPAF